MVAKGEEPQTREERKAEVAIAVLQTDITYIKEEMSSVNKKLDTFIDTCDRKYADKWTENIMKWALALFGVSALGFAMKQVFGW